MRREGAFGSLRAILAAKLRIVRNAVAAVRRESKLKVAVVSVSTLVLWGGSFYLARRGFRWLEGLGGDLLGLEGVSLSLGDVVMGRLLALFALALFLLLIFSNLLVSYATLYRSREVAWLVHSPLGWRTLFLARFGESVTLSSWASAFLGSPILLAYGLETGAPAIFYLALVAVYVPFVVLAAALGSLITMTLVMALTCWLPALPRLVPLALAVAGGGGLLYFFQRRFTLPAVPETAGLAGTLPVLLETFGRGESIYLPSQWAATAVLAAATGRGGEALFFVALLAANALFAVWVAAEVAATWFYPGWSGLMGRAPTASADRRRSLLGRLDTLLRPLPEPVRSLVVKDLRLFWRDAAQWSQFVIFFGVMALYAANMRRSSSAYDEQLWQSWLTLLNATVSLLILATLTTRFIFPLISLEGRRFWLLGLAPLTLRQLLVQKFLLSVVTTSVFSVGLVLISSLRLELGGREMAISLFTVGTATLALSGLAVGLGSLYPNFREDNPSRIVSGMGGTLTFILSMVFIVLVGAAQTVALQWPLLSRLAGLEVSTAQASGAALAFIGVLSAGTCLIPLRLGLRNLERADF